MLRQCLDAGGRRERLNQFKQVRPLRLQAGDGVGSAVPLLSLRCVYIVNAAVLVSAGPGL